MAEEWFVRVEGKEYGPVEKDVLQEWKSDGRLIPQNYLRKSGDTVWVLASTLEELFVNSERAPTGSDDPVRRRTLSEILRETLRVYRQGFLQFFALSLLGALPALGFKLSLAFGKSPASEAVAWTAHIGNVLAVVMLVIFLACWPIFVGGLQLATRDLAAGKAIRLKEILRGTVNIWPCLARLCLFVYGSWFFWIGLPMVVLLTLGENPSLPSALVALAALVFLFYMAARLFVNFMFWQQTTTLGELDGIEGLSESKELARSRADLPRLQRPLYRGAILVALWVVLYLGFSVAVELPFLLVRLQGVTDLNQAIVMMRALVNAPVPDSITIAVYVLSAAVHAALRPLLGIAFVVLYFDAKASR